MLRGHHLSDGRLDLCGKGGAVERGRRPCRSAACSQAAAQVVLDQHPLAQIGVVGGAVAVDGAADLGPVRDMKGQDGVDWQTMAVALVNVFLHRGDALQRVRFAERHRSHPLDRWVQGGQLQQELQQLVAQPILLHRRQHIDRQRLGDRAGRVVQRGYVAKIALQQRRDVHDALRIDCADNLPFQLERQLPLRVAGDARHQFVCMGAQPVAPAGLFERQQSRQVSQICGADLVCPFLEPLDREVGIQEL